MKHYYSSLRVFLVGIFFTALSQVSYGQCGCTFIVPTSANQFDGAVKGVKPGDKICLADGVHPGIWWNNINGTAANPVIITNMCNGTGLATLSAPSNLGQVFETTNSSYFHITGSSNTSVTNGIEITGAIHGFNLHQLSNHFEVDHVNIHDVGGVGIVAQTIPTCNTNTWRGNFLLQGISFHDLTISNTFNEGFYIGNSHYDVGVTQVCGGVSTLILEHDVQDVQIYNCTLNKIGNDGIQVGASKNAVIHHNTVNNAGYINTDPAQGNIFLSNPGSQCTAYNNFLNGGKGYGICDLGGGGTYYNNIVMNAAKGGMELQDIAPNFSPAGFTIFNNTFINCTDYGVWMYSENTNMSYYYNNIVVGQNQPSYIYVAFNYAPKNLWTESNNLRTQNITTVKFTNPATNDYHLLIGSPAIDAGKDVTAYGVNFDYDGKSKPKGTGFDIGALEFQPTGPKSNAGADQTLTLPTNSIILTGSGTSATGITSYQWTKKSGGAATLTNATSPTLSVSGLVQGIYVFELLVTDISGSDFDDVTVTVNAASSNQNPVANAGADKTITLPTSSVTINGTGTDADGTIASYLWVQSSGPAGATLTGPTTPNLNVTGMVAGVYVFTLTVTDNLGATSTDGVQVTVNAATVNQPPVVNAGATQTIFLPTNSVVLTGTATDADGTIASTTWTKKSGGAATLSGATTLTLTVTNLVAGTYVFRLNAKDNLGASVNSDVTVNVLLANQSPTANAGPDQTLTLPTNSTTLPGSGTDPDGTIASYAWVVVSGPSGTLTNANTATLTVTNMVSGTYVFGLTVTDNQGATGYDEVTVAVSVAPPPPNETPLAFAGGNLAFALPTNSANLYGSGFDPDGTITTYAWVKVAGGAVTLTNANTPTLTISNLVAGQYSFGLTVTDNSGATNTDIAIVTVSAAGTNISPVAIAGADKIVKLPQTTTNLTGSGTDADGQITTYDWSQVSGAIATIGSPSTSSTSINNLALGDYTFRLTVTDNLGATDFNDVVVRVVASTNNLPPVVSAGPDVAIFAPQSTLTLSGANASDDGTIVSYQWVKLSGPAATLNNPTQLALSLSNLVLGTYTFQLTVTDNDGASVFDIVTVQVLPATFQPPVVNAGIDQVITLPVNQVTLTGTASSPSGTITALLWTKTLGPAATLAGTTTLTLQVTSMVAGTYVFKITATDNSGTQVSDNVQVIVNPVPPNQPPVVTAGTNSSIQLPVSDITLTGTATDSDGTVAGLAWTQVSGPNTATLQNNQTLVLTASNLVVGAYMFKLTATDNLGATGSSSVQVSVSSAPPPPGPVVDAGQDTTLTLPNNTVSITGTSSDPTGTIIDYSWQQVSGETADFTVTGNTLNLADLKLGSYGFKLTVTDDNALTAEDDILVSVIEKNQEIPVFFSPNNDGIGDLWIFRNVDAYKQCKLSVFSRSGQIVFEAAPYTNTWDGTYNGKHLSNGDYYYNLKCDNGKVITGAVRIIR